MTITPQSPTQRKFIDLCTRRRVVAPNAMGDLLTELRGTDKTLIAAILEKKLARESQLYGVLGEMGIRSTTLEAVKSVPRPAKAELESGGYLPFDEEGGTVLVAVADPFRELDYPNPHRLLYCPPHILSAKIAALPDTPLPAVSQDPAAGPNAKAAQSRLLRQLLESGRFEAGRLQEIARVNPKPLEVALVSEQLISETELYALIAQLSGMPFDPKGDSGFEILTSISAKDAQDLGAMIIGGGGEGTHLLVYQVYQEERLADYFEDEVSTLLVPHSLWAALFDQVYPKSLRPTHKPKTLLEALYFLGAIDSAALRENEHTPQTERQLLAKGSITELQYAQALSAWKGVRLVDPAAEPPDPAVRGLVKEMLIRDLKVFPWRMDGSKLLVLVSDPTDFKAMDRLHSQVRNAETLIATPSAIARLVAPLEQRANMEELAQLTQAAVEPSNAPQADDNAVTRVLNGIIREAHLIGASDIHIEPEEGRLAIRVRVDGSLRELQSMPRDSGAALINRIKISANLKTDERRLPQDGKIVWEPEGSRLRLRVATFPTQYGEQVVMRLLREKRYSLNEIGYKPDLQERILSLIENPQGLILVNGPTGSGKTNTLASLLSLLATPDRKVLSIEDPIEFNLKGVQQAQINRQAGLDFHTAIRSFLRLDPDIMLVGELRDKETANIAIEAALTGHLVLGTLHANSAVGTIVRLLEMGIPDYNIVAALKGVMSQRLVGRLCPHCKQPDDSSTHLTLGMEPSGSIHKRSEKGCPRCMGSGHSGRIAIAELMVMNPELRRAVRAGASEDELEALAQQYQMIPIRQDGIKKIEAGLTGVAEVLKAITREL